MSTSSPQPSPPRCMEERVPEAAGEEAPLTVFTDGQRETVSDQLRMIVGKTLDDLL